MLAFNMRSVLLSASEGTPHNRLHRNSVLFYQGQAQDGVYLIESGMVKLTSTSRDGSRLILSVAGPNQLVGEECLVNGAAAYNTEAASLNEVTVSRVPLSGLMRLMNNSEFVSGLFSYLVSRQAEMAQKFELLCLRDVEYRVLCGLADLASLVKPNGSHYPIPMTQAEIASYVGATRETTSTVLSALKRRDLLILARRLVSTVHPDQLLRAANDGLSRTTTNHH